MTVNITNVSAGSDVIGFLIDRSGLLPNALGGPGGANIFFGLVIVLLFLGVLFYLHASLDTSAAVMLPLLFILAQVNLLPSIIGVGVLAVGGIIIAVFFLTLLRR